ncbi:MAG: leucine-rich repeat domain-containing protein, partial [Fibrobacter sp.]|nr:leucine-rich repeat domain-containing protein [Fibrobacter sp.]
FDDCKELNQIILPKALTYIGPWSFHGCDKIKSIDIPADVKEIQKYAFGSCENLEAINVDNANGKYCSVNGDLYSADGKTLFQYAVGKRNTSFILPSSVETIEFRAFSDAYFLEYIDLSNVRCVCEKAFYYARSLKNVRCKKGIMFGDHAFDFVHEDFTLEEW